MAQVDVSLDNESNINDSWIVNGIKNESLNEVILLYSKALIGMAQNISETLNTTDSLGIKDVKLISDWFVLVDNINENYNGNILTELTFNLIDQSVVELLYSLVISDSIEISDTIKILAGASILDAFNLAENQNAIGTYQLTVEDTPKIIDNMSVAFSRIIDDNIATTDSLASKFIGYLSNQETLQINEIVSFGMILNDLINENVNISVNVLVTQILQFFINDGINLSLVVETNGEEWQCLALNSRNIQPSVYSGQEFNSFTIFKRNAYGAMSNGIYKLDGNTDAGNNFLPGIIWRETDFGIPQEKRLRLAHFGVSGTTPILKVDTESGNDTFEIVEAKTYIDRDLYGKRYKLSLQNFDSVDFVELFPVILTR